MPVTTSNEHEVKLGTECPIFELKDIETGERISRDSLVRAQKQTGTFNGLCIMFICNHCPIVGLIRHMLAPFAKKYQAEGFAFCAIMPNEIEMTPMNGPDEMRAEKAQFEYPFPYCFDGDVQDVSKSFGAMLTPDFFVYDKDLKLVYRGAFDAARPKNQGMFKPDHNLFVTGKVGQRPDGAWLANALDALIKGNGKVPAGAIIPEHESEGCSIKWIRGKEPAWSLSEWERPDALEHHMTWNKRYYWWKAFYDCTYFFLGPLGFKRPALGNELRAGGI